MSRGVSGTMQWGVERSVPVARALARGRGAWAAAGASARAVLYAAGLSGEGRALGAHQYDADALSTDVRERLPVHRRATGGPVAVAGEGVVYVALALADASVLMECPRDRVLNRNVRPMLAALRRLGGAAHYFGREALSLDRRPAGLLGWTRDPAGAVLVELFLGVERSVFVLEEELGHPVAERLLGKAPTWAAAVLPSVSPSALAEALVEACGPLGRLEPVEALPQPLEAPAADGAPLRWSSPRSIPIGLLRAGLRTDRAGVVEHAALSGDFYQDAQAPTLLQAALVGGAASPERLRDALNAAYGPEGAVLEGLRSLQPALEAFLELA